MEYREMLVVGVGEMSPPVLDGDGGCWATVEKGRGGVVTAIMKWKRKVTF